MATLDREPKGKLELLAVWSEGLYEFKDFKLRAKDPLKRVRSRFVYEVKMEITPINKMPELIDKYADYQSWAFAIARQIYPDDVSILNIEGSVPAAFGLRVVEELRELKIDPREDLPRWIIEYAIPNKKF